MLKWNKYILEQDFSEKDKVKIDGEDFIKIKLRLYDILPSSDDFIQEEIDYINIELEKQKTLCGQLQNLNILMKREIEQKEFIIKEQKELLKAKYEKKSASDKKISKYENTIAKLQLQNENLRAQISQNVKTFKKKENEINQVKSWLSDMIKKLQNQIIKRSALYQEKNELFSEENASKKQVRELLTDIKELIAKNNTVWARLLEERQRSIGKSALQQIEHDKILKNTSQTYEARLIELQKKYDILKAAKENFEEVVEENLRFKTQYEKLVIAISNLTIENNELRTNLKEEKERADKQLKMQKILHEMKLKETVMKYESKLFKINKLYNGGIMEDDILDLED